MNKKLLPLLGIAFVVAVIATGVFYGLIVGRLRNATGGGPQRPVVVAARSLEPGQVLQKTDLKLSTWVGTEAPKDAVTSLDQVDGWTVLRTVEENEPLLRTRLASRQVGGGAALAVPSGMRAVSIQTPDSPGVLRLLRPGHKVDVQAIWAKNGPRSGEAEIRTILQGVEVLAGPEPAKQGGAAVLTVLAKPSEAEMLSLADAGARLRVVLRHPLDEENTALPGRDLVSLFTGRRSPPVTRAAAPKPVRAAPQPVAAVGEPHVRFEVRVVGAAPAAVEELAARLVAPPSRDSLQVAAFHPGWDLDPAVQNFQARRQLELLSSSSLVTGNHRLVGMQAGAAPCGIRVQLAPSISADGRIRLRVEAGPRPLETEVDVLDGQSLLITGLATGGESACYAGRETPAQRREVLVLVTPHLSRALLPPRPTAVSLARP